ncbi:hypothetical protein K443DRAFT_15028 [Laccaria amethystina LaAM-08-1]|uniref:Uncharacterized protein n=1 Tax=Laccaria amethystina LaAM-08-1 TaxID=1095629 RepID=A0A0C9X2A0_9AGAR|nr:hypothetical protein K443DRAFT_15028 [Laccaria amethystina LaAM-08-1]
MQADKVKCLSGRIEHRTSLPRPTIFFSAYMPISTLRPARFRSALCSPATVPNFASWLEPTRNSSSFSSVEALFIDGNNLQAPPLLPARLFETCVVNKVYAGWARS